MSLSSVVERPISTCSDVNLPPGVAVHDVYETLKRLANQGTVCREKVDTLVSKSGYHRRTVQRSLRTLEKLGYIRTKQYLDKYHRRSNVYYLTYPQPVLKQEICRIPPRRSFQ